MANVYHKNITTAQGIHPAVAYTAADAAARAALSAPRVHSVVYQEDDDSYWMVITDAPTFVRIDNAEAFAADGSIDITGDVDTTGGAVINDGLAQGWNGSTLEVVSLTVTESGGVISANIEASGGGDLTCRFGNASVTLDTTPAASVTLTAGTDTVPVISYVYLTETGGTVTLAASTSGWPSEDYAAIATVVCQSASSLATDGALKVHSWNDYATSTLQGRAAELARWVRMQPASWVSGVAAQDLTISSPDAYIDTTAGVVLTLQDQDFPARDMGAGDPLYVVNDPTTAYKRITTLDDVTQDAAGAAIDSKHFNIVLWGVASEVAADCKLFLNLPTTTYASSADATANADESTVYAIPAEYKGTGFLVAEFNVEGKASGAWVQNTRTDLRGQFPNTTAGGAGSGGGGGSGDPTMTGDVSGTASANTVDKIDGTAVSGTLTTGDAYVFNGTTLAVTEVISSDGSVAFTGNIDLGGFDITNVGSTDIELSATDPDSGTERTGQFYFNTAVNEIRAWTGIVWSQVGSFVRISSDDTSAGYIDSKIVAGTDMTLTVLNPGAGETLEINYTGAGGGTDDQTAAEVPFTPAGTITSTDVQAAIAEVDTDLTAASAEVVINAAAISDHTADATAAHAASAVGFTPAGTIAATNVQDAIAEVSGDVTAIDQTLVGDVTGAGSANTVVKMQGASIPAASPGLGQVLQGNGTNWILQLLGGDADGRIDALNVTGIRGFAVQTGTPATDQIMKFNGTQWAYVAAPAGTDDQVASEVPFTANGNITSTDVQAATVEVRDDAATANALKLTKSGDTMSGTLSMGTNDITNISGIELPSVASTGSLPTAGTHAGNFYVIYDSAGSDTYALFFSNGTSWERVSQNYDNAGKINGTMSFTSNTGRLILPAWTSAPTSPQGGSIYYDATPDVLKYYDNTNAEWKTIQSTKSLTYSVPFFILNTFPNGDFAGPKALGSDVSTRNLLQWDQNYGSTASPGQPVTASVNYSNASGFLAPLAGTITDVIFSAMTASSTTITCAMNALVISPNYDTDKTTTQVAVDSASNGLTVADTITFGGLDISNGSFQQADIIVPVFACDDLDSDEGISGHVTILMEVEG